MRAQDLLLTSVLVACSAACGGATAIDPLAPVPTKVDPSEVATPALRQAWKVSSTDEEGDRETPTHAAAVGEKAIFVAYADRLDALDLGGDKLWEAHHGQPLAFAPVALQGGVALASQAGWLWLDGMGSASAFLQLAGGVNDAVALETGLVVVGENSIQLLTLSPNQGLRLAWSTVLSGGRRVGASAAGDALYVTNSDGSVTALETATGRLSWRSTEVEVAPLRPAVGGAVYVIDRDGRLHALRRRDGKRRWDAKNVGMRVAGSPVLHQGLVWVPGLDAAVHAFTTGAGSHQFRIPGNGRIHLDLAAWGPWVVASPQYGPWLVVQGPRSRVGPSDPGSPRVLQISSDDDIALPPAVGPAGVVVIDSSGAVRLLTPEEGPGEAQDPELR